VRLGYQPVGREFPVFRILYTKGGFESRPLYERWNSYSRVQVSGNPDELKAPYARALSPTFPPERRVRELRVDIDVNASTSLLGYRGDLNEVDFLKYDVTNIGHYLRPNGDTLVIGTGGGRDVLAALIFGARSVTGVEINKQILDTVNGRFGEFGGHLDRDPRVRFVNVEARSHLARSSDHYDFLQISLIDTWAATAAGAFVLSENSVYTVEAWRIFLERLTDGGVLSVSRWYSESQPAEIYRLVSLAFSLPNEWKLRGGWNKYIVREAMKGVIAEPVRTRRDKMGFPTPSGEWWGKEWYEPMMDLLGSRTLRESGAIDVEGARLDLQQYAAGRVDAAGRLFRLAEFGTWLHSSQGSLLDARRVEHTGRVSESALVTAAQPARGDRA